MTRQLADQVRADRAHAIAAPVDDLIRFHREMVAKHGYLPDSVPLLRDMRKSG
jgi:hypothetical protein